MFHVIGGNSRDTYRLATGYYALKFMLKKHQKCFDAILIRISNIYALIADTLFVTEISKQNI